MATELAKAYVQIIPSAQGISGKIKEAIEPEAEPAGASFGGKLVGKLKGVIATAAIGKALGAAISEGANLEQSLGGIETLFKESADKVKANAAKAYQTAGMSANEYMELTTSFSASLLSSLGNDTSKAADAADMAMIDMSDNANKMGSNMEDIKNAYQGFAKQNYTMLDNLKLGYGGTKTEMERLLADAQKISGVEYNIDNLSDVYSAIHVIQGELDITGTTAKEAATTLSGSFGQMKAAAKNLIGNMALGKSVSGDLYQLRETIVVFLKNLIPMIGNVLSALPDLVKQSMTLAVQFLNLGGANAKKIVSQGVLLVSDLANAIISGIPYLAEAAVKIALAFGKALVSTDWIAIAKKFMTDLKENIYTASDEIFGTDTNIVDAVKNAITANLPKVVEKGAEIVETVRNAITANLPKVVEKGAEIVETVRNAITANLPKVVEKGAEIVETVRNAITTHLPGILEKGVEIIKAIEDAITSNLPNVFEKGAEIIKAVQKAIADNLPGLLEKGIEIVTAIRNAIASSLPIIFEKGAEIVRNLVNGILQNLPQIMSTAASMIANFVNTIISLLPTVLKAGVSMLANLVSGMINDLPQIVTVAAQVVAKMIATIGQNLPRILQSGIEIIGMLVSGLIRSLPKILQTGIEIIAKLAMGLVRAIPNLVAQVPKIVSGIRNAFTGVDWGTIGHNIIQGIGNGLRNAGHMLWDAVKGVLGSFKENVLSFFGIHSPSRWGIYVGQMLDNGFAKGIEGGFPAVSSAADSLRSIVTSPFADVNSIYDLEGMESRESNKETSNRLDTLIALLRAVVTIIEEKDNGSVSERELLRTLRDMGVVFG